MKLKGTVFFIIYCLCFIRLTAQSNQYLFSHIDVSAGLSNNHINYIYKDSKGFMWFSTISGLNRYDGYQFRVFRHNMQDTNSLSDNYVDRIFEDFNGKLWVETRGGFNIYDPAKLKVDRNIAAYLRKYALPEAGLANIIKSQNNYWLLYPSVGIFKYMKDGKTVAIKNKVNDDKSIDASLIIDIKADSKGDIWLVHLNGLIEKIDGIKNKVVYRKYLEQSKPGIDFTQCKMFIDGQNDVWVYGSVLKGVYYYREGSNVVKLLSEESAVCKLSSNLVFGIVQDDKGLIWISTDHGGVNVVDKRNFSVINIINKSGDLTSLAENSIGPMYKDNLGTIWLGTFKKGVDYYQPNAIHFPHYSHQASNPATLPYDDVNSFAEDKLHNLWIGTNGGGLIYFSRKENSFRQLTHNPGNTNSLGNDIIVSMYLDHENKMWIGTYYGGLDCYDGKVFTHYRHKDDVPNSLSDDRVMSVYEDSNNDLWAGTLSGGLNKYDKATNSFIHFKENEPHSIPNNSIASIIEDAQKNLWVGTAYGIGVMDRSTGKFRRYLTDNSKLSNNNISSMLNDSRGNIWVGTREGLNLLNPDKNTFQSFRTEDGLANNTIRGIEEDNQHNIWVSTSNGLSKIELKPGDKNTCQISCKNFDELDGLQGKEYNNNAGLTLKTGELVFGGPGGYNLFNPGDIKSNPVPPSIVFTDFQVFNKPVIVNEKTGNHIILPNAISETKEVTLRHNENVFSIEFASLSFTNTIKEKYAYKLEGFNKEWQYTDGKIRTATYTNLDPGEYTFRVKASNEDGVWNEEGIAVNITVLPPLWKTRVAYFLYVLVIAAGLYIARQIVIQRAKLRFALEQQRKETQRIHEVDMMKIKFFTNVSHEFRTPLSLIITPLDKIIANTHEPVQKQHFQLIQRNAKRLLNMVNQLLDFRKLEVQEIKLNLSKGDIVQFIKDAAYCFTDIAEKKQVQLVFQSSVSELEAVFDKDKLERILFNLLSNAFKFTLQSGTVSVLVNKAEITLPDGKTISKVQIQIKDTGIGIPLEKKEKIFENFFQLDMPGSIINQGSGIGLSITKEFVRLHKGSINVDSEADKGSCFTILLPLTQDHNQCGETFKPSEDHNNLLEAEEEIAATITDAELATITAKRRGKKPTVLLVEDNEDFRFYLKDNLREFYSIIEAQNGKAGWDKVLQLLPDLVVTDVNMPEMSGIELCKKIKTDTQTAHIPVIILTARSGQEHQLEGYETGANDYMGKPFNFEILQFRIKNLLVQQEKMRKLFQKQIEVNPTEITITSLDEKFIIQALEVVEKNMGQPDFSVEDFSREMFMSRVSLYKKIHSLTGKAPIEFIRSIRLKRAAQLLEKSQLSISEIAYEVGFNNPKYFAKYFKAEFNVNPSVYQNQKKGTNYLQ